jgi:UDP-N-acetylmuramate dehydrogenase
MLEIEELVSLKPFNTFGIEAIADYWITIHSEDELLELYRKNYLLSYKCLILGGGSNVLFLDNFKGIVIHPDIKGVETISEDEDSILIKVYAGEDWDSFVKYAVDNDWGGIENLSGIPGKVGAAPIQNIGAYGIEVKDTLVAVEGFNIQSGEFFHLENFECELSYRSSIFKTHLAGKAIVTSVIFRLTKTNHSFKLSYSGLVNKLKASENINLQNIRKAIISLRDEKLPNPALIGNAGSFFKNPVVNQSKAIRLKADYPNIPLYEAEKDRYKISAAWLIEQCGWKGFRNENVGVFEKQPLVLVNYGNATGMEILNLATEIQDSIKKKFDVDLEMEVNIIS